MACTYRIAPTIVAVLLAAGILTSATTAAAQDLAGKGTLVLSVDRIFGFVSSTLGQEDTVAGVTTETTLSSTDFSILGRQASNANYAMYSVPRLNADYLVADRISVGAGLGISLGSSETEVRAGNVTDTNDGPSRTSFILAPRAGYVLGLTDNLALWPRLALTFQNLSSETDTVAGGTRETSTNLFGFGLEVPLLWLPAPSVGLSLGLTMDAATGSSEETIGNISAEVDAWAFEVGLQAGLSTWF